uniref:VOC domain-containing protein n=1 Tax=Noctiluca scintillans TaxID=2966 RepID=A0A7S1F9W4_NOCSC
MRGVRNAFRQRCVARFPVPSRGRPSDVQRTLARLTSTETSEKTLRRPVVLGLDHAGVGVRCLTQSLEWYRGVLGMTHVLAEDPAFNDGILMVGVAGVPLVALLELPEAEAPLTGSRSQRGHFAVRVSEDEFAAFRQNLPKLLRLHAGTEAAPWIQEDDFGRQRSLFFFDPDGNEVEVTTWLQPPP